MDAAEEASTTAASFDRAAWAYRSYLSASDNPELDPAAQSFCYIWYLAERALLRSLVANLTTPGMSVPPVELLQALLHGATMTEATKPTSAAGPSGARAGGGPVTGGRSYLVGEKGPELWQAPSNGRIIPNSSTMSMMRSARGGLSAASDRRPANAPVNITTNVNVTGSVDRSMADTLAERIGQKVRRSLDGLHADLSMA